MGCELHRRPELQKQQRQTQQTDPGWKTGLVEWLQGRRGDEPWTPNAGENPLHESERLKEGPEYHITLRFLPDGDTSHLRRSTLNPKDTTDRVRFMWQALALGNGRCTSRDLTSPAAALKSSSLPRNAG